MRILGSGIVLFVLFIVLGACVPEAAGAIAPLPAPRAGSEAIVVAGDAMTAGELYDQLAPSMAYVDIGNWYGSGFIVELGGEKYVVTNWHVLWPRVKDTVLVFPDGSEYESPALVGWDPLADVALLGPVDIDFPPLSFADSAQTRVGDEVYNIGYPNESELFPQPALARGLVSRIRNWDAAGITYIQTDVSSAGGQSGGALITPGGEVLGMTSYSFGDGNFDVAISAKDVDERIRAILAGESLNDLGPRLTVGDDTDDGTLIDVGQSVAGALDYWGDVDVYRANLTAGQSVKFLLESMLLNTFLSVGPVSGNAGDLEFDDDSAASFVHGNAYLDYKAPVTGEYVIIVDAYDEDMQEPALGGYVLSLWQGE
ncbi:MAG: S1C family serine protease [Caldilineaceae bacterium]